MYRQQQRVEKSQTIDDLYLRAREARAHRCRHTFAAPETLMHLISVQRSYLRLRKLVEGHWEQAQQESGHSDRDLFLWTQALGWNEQQNE